MKFFAAAALFASVPALVAAELDIKEKLRQYRDPRNVNREVRKRGERHVERDRSSREQARSPRPDPSFRIDLTERRQVHERETREPHVQAGGALDRPPGAARSPQLWAQAAQR